MTTTQYRVIGSRPVRHDGADKVTGKAIYTADTKLPGMLAGFVLRSPHAHAKIISIDTSEAEATPGVHAILTNADFPNVENKIADLGEGSVNLSYLSANCMAQQKVLYRGHAVAAVAATDVHIAEEAARKIKVEYEVLDSVTWVLDAMEENAPLLHEDIVTDSMGEKADKPSNIPVHLHFEKGDAAAAFEEADVIVEREFKTATVHQGYIEPHAVVADYNEDGRLRIWTATQGSFTCRQQTAEILQIPLGNVLVTPCEIGGGFGGKITVYLEPTAALLSKKAGRPVRIAMTRADVFEASGPTPGSFMRVKIGAKNDGTLIAGEAWLAYDAGAYPGGMIGPGRMCVFSCYDIDHAIVDGYDVLLNKPKTSAYRAPGATQVAFATEQLVDEIAEKFPQMRDAWDDYNQVYLTNMVVLDSYQVFSKEPIWGLEDFEGLKINGAGTNLRYLHGLGSAGVAGSLVTYFQNINTGVVDAAIVWPEAAISFKMQEVAPYMLQSDMGTVNSKALTVNKRTWEKLPEEVQRVLTETAIDYRDHVAKLAVSKGEESLRIFQESGGTITTMSAEERQQWAMNMPNIAKEWADGLEEKGLPGHEILKYYMDAMRANGQDISRHWDRE